jgi:hypothetical protein
MAQRRKAEYAKQRLQALQRYIDLSKMEYQGNLDTQEKLRKTVGMGGQLIPQEAPQQNNQPQGMRTIKRNPKTGELE